MKDNLKNAANAINALVEEIKQLVIDNDGIPKALSSIFLKNNYYFVKKPPKKFGGFVFYSYLCIGNKNNKHLQLWQKHQKIDLKAQLIASLIAIEH